MGYGLKRLLEIEKERNERKKQKEEIKKNKELEKKKLIKERKKERNKQKRKKKNNRKTKKRYNKLREKEVIKKIKEGDEYKQHIIYLVLNGKKIKMLGKSWWKLDAYQKFENIINDNNKNIKFKEQYKYRKTKEGLKKIDLKYELILIQKQDTMNNTNLVKNEIGKYVLTEVADSTNYIILKKELWFKEKDFIVHGFDSRNDKKTYNFIYDTFIKNEDNINNIKRVIRLRNKIIIDKTSDFNFVTCEDINEAIILYNTLYNDSLNDKLNYVFFMGSKNYNKTHWYNKLEIKTGKSRDTLKRKYISK